MNYYEAYDTRYKQVHEKGLSWSPDNNTPIVIDTIHKYRLEKEKMLEIGCGEGRDARYLLGNHYEVLATDISKEAIEYCQKQDEEHRNHYRVLNVLEDKSLEDTFGFIYSIACLHMLVLENDRNRYYEYIYNHLEENGYCLILTMGDGIHESQSDIKEAFENVTRIHQETNEEIEIAATSCKIVNFDTLTNEVESHQFEIIEQGITSIENHFNEIMYILIKKIQNF